jgi:hypothetical protein
LFRAFFFAKICLVRVGNEAVVNVITRHILGDIALVKYDFSMLSRSSRNLFQSMEKIRNSLKRNGYYDLEKPSTPSILMKTADEPQRVSKNKGIFPALRAINRGNKRFYQKKKPCR